MTNKSQPAELKVHTHALEHAPVIHELSGYIQQTYLVEYPDKLLLLDGASRPDAPKIVNYIQHTLKREPSDLKLVVITHFHPDHAGAASALKKITGCQIASRQLKRHWYGGVSGTLSFLIDIYLANWVAGKMKKPKGALWFNPRIIPDMALTDGQVLPDFTDWQVVFTEGHTDRDISLYHKDSGMIYIADLFVKTKRGFVAPFPVCLPSHYKRSLKRVFSLAPRHFLLAHGGIIQQLSKQDESTILNKAPNLPYTIKTSAFKRLGLEKFVRHKGMS